jgi:tRNA G18 (ribose-2'-O)-methylase SpoU
MLPTPITTPPQEVRDLLRPLRHDFSVALYAAGNAFAVGAVIRVAHNFLAREIILIGEAPYYEKASMGMEKYESIVRVEDDDAFLRLVEDRPVWAFEKDRARRSVYAIDAFPKDVVLLFGSERSGIPAHVLDRADDTVGIPIYGVNHSLPLAVAAGIAMHEIARRKYSQGAIL